MIVRYYGLHTNALRGKIKKASLAAFPIRIVEGKPRRIPSNAWAEMMRNVYEIGPMLCPKRSSRMKVIAFITNIGTVDQIIYYFELTFVAGKPPLASVFEQVAIMEAEERADYF